MAESQRRVVGFVMWTEKSGFRAQAVLELEQIAVAPQHRRRGIAEALIRRSLAEVEKELEALKAVVSPRARITPRSSFIARRSAPRWKRRSHRSTPEMRC